MWEVVYSLFAVSAGSLCLLSVLLLFNFTGVNTLANRWLGAFYLFLAFALFQQFMEKMGLAEQSPVFVHGLELSRWALAPCFYIALLYFVNPGKKSPIILAHFIPMTGFVIFSFLFITPHFFGSQPAVELPASLGFFFRYFSILQALVYWLLSFKLINSHSKNIRLISSNIESIDLFWVKQLLLGTIVLLILRIASHNNSTFLLLTPVLYSAGIFYIAFYSLKQRIIYPVTASDLPQVQSVLTEKKTTERLSSDQVDELKSRVLIALESKQLFLDPTLTLPALSKHVGVGIHELSYVINNGFNKNFYSLINEMRIAEAKKILLSEQHRHLDMVGIAILAGFNSKTTFNTTFKRLTGLTPTEFLKSEKTNK
jgi:AraC-like DNA-binding protein